MTAATAEIGTSLPRTNTNPCDPQEGFRQAFKLGLVFALIKFFVQCSANLLQAHLGWGYFTDEFYYILCGQRLDWAYVDHGPIVALQARAATALFGKSLLGIRMFAALAGSIKLLLTGILAWQLGVGRKGQLVALTGVLLCQQYLGSDGFLSMNSFEPVFWMLALVSILQLLERDSLRWWIVLGLSAGIGGENKPSMVFFLAALILALLVTRERRVLLSRGVFVGIGIAALLVLPNLLWQLHHGWATFQFLHNATTARHSSIRLFLPNQAFLLGVLSVPLVVAGLGWLLFNRNAARFRFLGWTYIFFVLIMTALRSKPYYLAAIYPLLFAAGGGWYQAFSVTASKRRLANVCLILIFAGQACLAPLVLAVVTPDRWLALARTPSFHGRRLENNFPDFFALRFGWQELTDDLARIYNALPEADRKRAGIFCSTWNTASAVNFLGPARGLPPAISGHNNFFLWGPRGDTGAVMIVVTEASREDLLKQYASVEEFGSMHHPYAIPLHTNIYLCRDRRVPFSNNWQDEKRYY